MQPSLLPGLAQMEWPRLPPPEPSPHWEHLASHCRSQQHRMEHVQLLGIDLVGNDLN